MSGSTRSEAAAPAAISRRDAIMGALALAAGSLIASKPEVARAANYETVTVGDYGLIGTLPTAIMRTSNGTISGNAYSTASLNYIAPITNADVAVQGTVWDHAPVGSAGVSGRGTLAGHNGVVATHDLGTGTALKVVGRTAFSRSGKATVGHGHTVQVVTVPSGIDTTSLILATLQGDAGSGVYLRYARRESATTFRIKLNKAAAANVTVAWFIVG